MSREESRTSAQADEATARLNHTEDPVGLVLVEATQLLDHYRSELAAARRRITELETGAARASQDAEWRKLLELRPLPAAVRLGDQVVHYERIRLLLKSLSLEQLREGFAMLSAEQASAFEAVYVGYAKQERGNVAS